MLKVIGFLFSVICIIILIMVYRYLDQLSQCECFRPDAYINIEYLKTYQIFHIITFILYMLFNFVKRPIDKRPYFITFMNTKFIILIIGLYGYTAYNIFNFHQYMKKDCKCLAQIERYFLYIEGASSTITTLFGIYAFLMIFVILITNQKIDHF
jgi:hypothetical protein